MSHPLSQFLVSPNCSDNRVLEAARNVEVALRAHVDIICARFDETAVTTAARDSLSLMEHLACSGLELVNIWRGNEDRWISKALSSVVLNPALILTADRNNLRSFVSCVYENQTRRLTRQIEMTISEEIDRRKAF